MYVCDSSLFPSKRISKNLYFGVYQTAGGNASTITSDPTTKAAGFILIHGFLTHSKTLRMCPDILFHERTAKSKMLTSPFKVHYLSAAMPRAGERETFVIGHVEVSASNFKSLRSHCTST